MSKMNWKALEQAPQLKEIKNKSLTHPVLIFKHSTRCSVSSMALNRLERSWDSQDMTGVELYFLDLIALRDVSNLVAEEFGVYHESPQILLIYNGECVYNTSHMGISYRALKDQLDNAQLV